MTKSLNCPHQSQGHYLPQCGLATNCPLKRVGHYSYFECDCVGISAQVASEIAAHLGGKVVEGQTVWQIVLSSLVSSKEATTLIDVSPTHFRHIVKARRLQSIEQGKSRMWLKADIEAIRAERASLNQGTIPTAELAAALGVSPNRVRVIGKKFKQPAHGKWNLADWLPIIAKRGKE